MLLNEVLVNSGIGRRKTKIVATVGPASNSPEKLKQLISAGANVFRLNFSHGSYEDHLEILKKIRAVSDEMGVHTAILQDLAGPKIRISMIEGDFITIKDGEEVELRPSDGSKSDQKTIFVEALDPSSILKEKNIILLGDGGVVLECKNVSSSSAKCRILNGGRIRSRMGIAFPDSQINIPAATPKDLKDVEWGIKNGVDYIAISFVTNAQDVLKVRGAIVSNGGQAKIIAKIERKLAVSNIEEILDVSDGIMVARGDLGIELPLEKVPMIQKLVIQRANYRGLPVIVATQMLQSMITSVRPTRAEVSDVATAVMNGADAVMLSEETAIGEHPVESVQYLHKISHEAERTFLFSEYKLRLRESDHETVPDAIAYAACGAAIKLQAAAVIACTETGYTARLIAKYRPQQPLYGISSCVATLRRMALYWGVTTILCRKTDSHTDEIDVALKAVQLREELQNGSKAVVTGGLSVNVPGATSVLEVREMSFLDK